MELLELFQNSKNFAAETLGSGVMELWKSDTDPVISSLFVVRSGKGWCYWKANNKPLQIKKKNPKFINSLRTFI